MPALPSAHKGATDAEEDNATSAETPHRQPISRHQTAVDDEDNDDDAAPEEISLSTAQAQSHVQRSQATGAVLAQSLAQKRRRRRKDTMLKAQAASSSRKQKLGTPDEDDVADEDKGDAVTNPEVVATEETHEEQDQISLDNLPAILPDSILLGADEAASARGAAADAPHKRSSRLNVRRRVAIKNKAHEQIRVPTSKRPKDVRRGPVFVRVLETQSSLLPPKTVSATRSIRETWLKGRKGMVQAQALAKKGRARGNSGADKMERRMFGIKGRVRPFV
jgi:U3 small nucleolar RNA-associated protein 16